MSTFDATGKGYFNKWPDFPANEQRGNGLLKNDAVNIGDADNKLWMFVTGVGTQWSVQGAKSQTQGRTTFYPQHLIQGDLIIKGIMPNQYEYDRLVQFVTTHHRTALGLAGRTSAMRKISSEASAIAGGQTINFQLAPYSPYYWVTPDIDGDGVAENIKNLNVGKGRYQIVPINIDGVITEIRAGASRFVNAPEFNIAIKVTRDHMHSEYTDGRAVDAMRSYVRGLADKSGRFYERGPETYSVQDGLAAGGDILFDYLNDTVAADVIDAVGGDGTFQGASDAASDFWNKLIGRATPEGSGD